MNKLKQLLILGSFTLALLSSAQEAAKNTVQETDDQKETKTLTVDQIVSKANIAAYYPGKDGKAKVNMVITDKSGKVRKREFIILRRNPKEAGDQKFYVYFKAPADVRKMAYLVWKHVDEKKDDDRWLWLPALNLKKRIAPGDKRTSFAGSDFFYEDVSGRSLKEDKHELIETTDTQYKIKSTPVKADAVEFAYYYVWIDKDTFLSRKAEYFDSQNKKYRIVESVKVKTIGGFATVIEAKASDLESGSVTVNTFSGVKYDLGLKDKLFTERYLKRPPKEVRK